MSVLRSAKRAGRLDIAELAPLDVVAVLKIPADAEWSKAHTQRALVAIADSGRSLLHFDGFPHGGVGFSSAPAQRTLARPLRQWFGICERATNWYLLSILHKI